MNPVLPLHHFIPDVEAHVGHDGRLYAYGSQDLAGNHTYCSHSYRVFSTDNLLDWVNHGTSFASAGPDAQTPWSTAELYAPDCVYKDGTYYLYFCQKDRSEGVAVSQHPAGPFTDASTIPHAHKDAIDPTAFVDDDGQAYLYWGQYQLRGARLNPDMRTIDESTLNKAIINEDDDGFHEGPSMHKIGDTYYLLFCDTARGQATCLSYATGTSPLGPFEKKGVIIDNDGCQFMNWNNHGSIVEFQGQWYIFYHRASQGSNFNRRVCLEKIEIAADGSIAEVEMTTQGVEGPIPASRTLEATRACLMTGEMRSEFASDETEFLARTRDGESAAYKYIDFSRKYQRFSCHAAAAGFGGCIELHIDAEDGPIIGVVDIPSTGGWQRWREFTCSITQVEGVHALYLVFRHRQGHDSKMQLVNLRDFRFL